MPTRQTFTVPGRGVGLPDYSNPAPIGQVPVGPVYTSSDIAELAARLSSPDNFDRRGNVIFMDDFRNGISRWRHYDASVIPPAYNPLSWVADYAATSGFACKVTTEAVANDLQEMITYLPYPYLSKMGFEVAFSMGLNIDSIDFALRLDDGSFDYQWIIVLFPSTNKLYYLDVNGAQVEIPTSWAKIPGEAKILGSIADTDERLFHIVKLVVDTENKKYVRLIFNNSTFDMSNIACYPSGTIGARLESGIGVITAVDVAATIRIGHVIATINEPKND